ncbi:hypothetical protein EIP86_005847 [Pleurotus ostreatoroseus]|nr:hypothetical protein EIP86_005847 [Pleurotus ostreatoroseus]
MAVITRASDPKSPREPAPGPAPAPAASRGGRSRRGTPRPPPASSSSRSRGLILGPLAEGRSRGTRAGPVPRGTTARPSGSGLSVPVAFVAGPGGPPVSFTVFGDSAAPPRAASEGPFAPGPPAPPPREHAVLGGHSATPVPSTSGSPIPLPTAAAHGGIRGSPAAPAVIPIAPPDRIIEAPAREPDLAARRASPAPANDVGTTTSARAAGKARALSLSPSLVPLDEDVPSRDHSLGASPRRDASPAPPVPGTHADGDAEAPGGEDDTFYADALSQTSAEEVLEWGPSGGPETPPRRNASTEPHATLFTTGVAALLEEVQRLLPAAPSASTSGPSLSFTPKPAEGFPYIHDAIPAAHLANLTKQQAIDWEKFRGPKILVRFGMHGALDDTIHDYLHLADRATSELHAFLGTSSATVALPLPKVQPSRTNEAPYAALIRGVSEEEAARLLDQQVLATPRITLFFFPFGWKMPTLLGAITGFRASDEEEVYDAVRDRLEPLIPMIMTLAYENPVIAAAVSLESHAAKVIKSIRVKFLPLRTDGGHPDDHYYVYASLPFTTFTSFQAVQRQLAAADWKHSFAGPGTFHILREPFCSLCHGADHPLGLCPFPSIPDWITARDPPPPPPPRDVQPRGPSGPKRRAEDQGRGDSRRKAPRNY